MVGAFTLLLLAAAPPQPFRVLMSVGEAPVGVISGELDGGVWVYRSLHVYRSSGKERVARLSVDAEGRTQDGRVPETLWLSTVRPVSCVDAVDELTLRPERVCVRRACCALDGGLVAEGQAPSPAKGRGGNGSASHAWGDIDGAPFVAKYGAGERLEFLGLLESGVEFHASTDLPLDGVDPFEQGFPVEGRPTARARPRLAPASANGGVVVLESPPLGVADQGGVGERAGLGHPAFSPGANCLEVAKGYVDFNAKRLSLVLGVVLEDGRAWPHAWLKDLRSGAQLDPTLEAGDRRLASRRYLAFPTAEAGLLYLKLRSGAVRVAWAEPGSPR